MAGPYLQGLELFVIVVNRRQKWPLVVEVDKKVDRPFTEVATSGGWVGRKEVGRQFTGEFDRSKGRTMTKIDVFERFWF